MNYLLELKSGRLFSGEPSIRYSAFNGYAYAECVDEKSDTLTVICRREVDTWREHWRLSKTLKYFELGIYKFV